MKIIISGSVGTGKTTVSELLGKQLELKVIHVNELIQNTDSIVQDEVDLKQLKKIIPDEDEIILESHLLCEIPLDNQIIILRCHPKVLSERLKERKYSKDKLKENLEAEAVDYCVQIAEKNYKSVIQVDTTKLTPDKVCDRIIEYLQSGESDNPDFSDFLLEEF